LKLCKLKYFLFIQNPLYLYKTLCIEENIFYFCLASAKAKLKVIKFCKRSNIGKTYKSNKSLCIEVIQNKIIVIYTKPFVLIQSYYLKKYFHKIRRTMKFKYMVEFPSPGISIYLKVFKRDANVFIVSSVEEVRTVAVVWVVARVSRWIEVTVQNTRAVVTKRTFPDKFAPVNRKICRNTITRKRISKSESTNLTTVNWSLTC